jgi:hypothetical protein
VRGSSWKSSSMFSSGKRIVVTGPGVTTPSVDDSTRAGASSRWMVAD